jgi:branched-chain amino acid transport system permease protein
MASVEALVVNQIVRLLNSLYYSSIVFLVAVGLSFVYGYLNLLNLAHVSFLGLGAFLGAELIFGAAQLPSVLGTLGPFIVILVVAPLLIAVIGTVFEYTIFRPLYDMEEAFQLLATFGIVLMLEGVLEFIWGGESVSATAPRDILGTVGIGSSTFPLYVIFVIAVTGVVAAGLYYFFESTRLGRITIAMSEDPDIVRTCGIDVRRIHLTVLLLSVMLAGLGGVLWVPNASATVGVSLEFLILAFAVVVIGGLGSLKGAIVGAILVGLIRTYGLVFFPAFSLVLVFLLMAAVVVIKPTGLYGGIET